MEDLHKEMGDCLIVLAQMAAKEGLTLPNLLKRRYEAVVARGKAIPSFVDSSDPQKKCDNCGHPNDKDADTCSACGNFILF